MSASVTIPVWALLLAWAIGGLLIGAPWINSKAASMVLVQPSAGQRIQLALGVVAGGPIIWTAMVGAFVADLFAALRRKLALLTRRGPDA